MSNQLCLGPEEFAREMRVLDPRFDAKVNFEMFLEQSYCLVAMQASQGEERKQVLHDRHTRAMGRYGERKGIVADRFVDLFTQMSRSIARSQEDFLGLVFTLLGFGNRATESGDVQALAEALSCAQKLNERLLLVQPNCGSGVVAMYGARVIRSMGHDFEKCLMVIATESDKRCFQMTCIQLALMEVPAVVIHGDVAKRTELDRLVNCAAQRQCARIGGASAGVLAVDLEQVATLIAQAQQGVVARSGTVVSAGETGTSAAESSSAERGLELGGDAKGVFHL